MTKSTALHILNKHFGNANLQNAHFTMDEIESAYRVGRLIRVAAEKITITQLQVHQEELMNKSARLPIPSKVTPTKGGWISRVKSPLEKNEAVADYVNSL